MSTNPRRLGKYELRERLGQGGMAEVWKAFDTQLQRYVAIKFLHANLRDDPNFVTRFQREAQLIASLHHPNIVQIHDFQVTSVPEVQKDASLPTAYMVMDYVEGQTLATYIRNTSGKGQIPAPADILRLFTSIGLAIDYAHQRGMIHRDIKPSNILLDVRNTTANPMGEPILTDFGVARMMSVSSNTLSGALLGTPLYISPEQAKGYPGNERSDLYSLGVILYEMVTGVTPFRGDNPLDVMNQHANVLPPPPALINPRIPPALSLVILRALAKDPSARFPSASSMVAALAEALGLPIPGGVGQPTYPLTPLEMPTRMYTPTGTEMIPQGASGSVLPSPSTGPAPALSGQRPTVTPVVMSNPSVPPTQVESAHLAAALSTPQASPAPVAPSTRRPRRNLWLSIAAAALAVLVLAAGLLSYFVFFRPTPAPSPVVGHAFFVSSGQIVPNSTQGIADQLRISLQNIPVPPSGKSYYAWLLGDITPVTSADLLGLPPVHPPILLSSNLPVHNGAINFLYTGDAAHDNLFSATSRLLITLEDTGSPTNEPSSDRTTWKYYAALPQQPIPNDPNHFSALIHIRHLFYNETGIKVLGLPGGLDVWFTRNTEKTVEWTVSARDDWNGQSTTSGNISLMQAQFVRILDYLDGASNVHLDVPTGTALLADPVFSRVAMLTVDPKNQGGNNNATNPPGYVDHIQFHVSQVAQATDITPRMRALTAEIIDALSNVKSWLTKARADAVQLVHMSSTQLMQPSAGVLLDDLTTQLTYAYIGQLDPLTNQVHPGVLQMHYDIQQLATFTVTTQIPQKL